MPYIAPEILDTIFGFVPSVGLHVSKKYNAGRMLVDGYTTGRHYFIVQHRANLKHISQKNKSMKPWSRNKIITIIYNIYLESNSYKSYVYEYIRELNTITKKTVIDSINSGRYDVSHIRKMVHRSVLEDVFSDSAFIGDLLIRGYLSDDIIPMVDDHFLEEIYVLSMTRLFTMDSQIVSPEKLTLIVSKFSKYNHLLGDVFFTSTNMSLEIKIIIARSLSIDTSSFEGSVLAVLLK